MKAGDMVGDYEIVRPLGEGGMATVFVARDTRHDREVVLKAMPPYLNSPTMEARFRREIQAIASLSHPNVVKVMDFSVTSTLAWFVMPFVPAADLEKFAADLRGGAMAPPLKAFAPLKTILMDVASALAHCHERGVFHRDIKPQNILVDLTTRRGILSDFGLARAENLTNLTKSREMLGTLRYMSPEMMLGSDVGGSSDVYQLALVTYEIFAGQLPFTAANPYDELKRRHTEPIPSIRTYNPTVSEELSEFVVRSMSAKIDDRPSTMEIFLEGLRSCPLEYRASRGLTTPRSVTVALSRSQELSASLIQQELARKRRNKRAGLAAAVAATLAALFLALKHDDPKNFAISPGYQDARITSSGGPRFRVELAGERGAPRTVDPVPQDRGFSALAAGLVPGQLYTASWVLEDGRRGGATRFRTEDVAVAQVTTELTGGKLKLAFETSRPMRARLLKGEEPYGPELDAEPAADHHGEIAIGALASPDLRALLTDPSGRTARVELGAVAVPEALANDALAAMGSVDVERLFRECALNRWRKEGRAKLAEYLRAGLLKRPLAGAESFRPLAPLYFGSQAVPLSKRMESYRQVSKLYHAEGLLAREQVPIRFDVPGLLGMMGPTEASSLNGSALSIQLVSKAKLKYNSTKDLRTLSATVYDAVEEANGKLVQDVTVEREIRGIRDLKKAELVMSISNASRDVYFFVEINGRYRLLFVPPNYAKVYASGPGVVLHHAFDPRLLEDGPNRFRVGVDMVADFPFNKAGGDIDLLELEAQ